jgi:hypothetical protein
VHLKNQGESLSESPRTAPTQCAKQANTHKHTEKETRQKHAKQERENHKSKQNQTTTEATDLEQKGGWTWIDSEVRMAGHAMRWIRWRMGDRAETN